MPRPSLSKLLALAATSAPPAAGLAGPLLPPARPDPPPAGAVRGGDLLRRVTSHSLPEFQRPVVAVLPELPRGNATGPFLTVSYYKTGCVVGRAIHWALFGYDSDYFKAHIHKVHFTETPAGEHWASGRYWDAPLESVEGYGRERSFHLEFPTATWRRPPNARTVYFVRDPVKQIVSAYRYDMLNATLDSADRFVALTAKCGWCDLPSHHAVFELCDFGCSIRDLLGALPQELGVMVEATLQSFVLQQMVANIERWANDPDVLLLSVDHLRADFDGAMKCMLDFGDLREPGQLERLRRLDEGRFRSSHATHGLFNNTELERILSEQPAVAEPLTAVRSVLRSIYERQRRLYGCPVPEP